MKTYGQKRKSRRAVLEEVATHLGPKHPICYDSYCLCDLSHERNHETFSVAMLKDKYFEIPFSSRDRKKNLVANLSEFPEGCVCNQPHLRTNRDYSKLQGFSTSNSKKSWKQLFFKNSKSRIRKEHVFCQPYLKSTYA